MRSAHAPSHGGHAIPLLLALVLPGTATLAAPPGSKTRQSFAVEDLALTSAPGSSVPFVSAGPAGSLLASWMEPAGQGRTLRFASWRNGHGWSAVRTVATGAELLSASSSPPSVIALPDGSLAAQWLVKGRNSEDNSVLSAVSRDGGLHWSAPVNPCRDATPGEHMYVSLYPSPGGGAGIVWLDPRGGRTTSLMHTILNPDGKPGTETAIDSDVCSCCPTATAVTRRGPVLLYRDHMPDETRDIHIAAFEHGRWTPGQPVHRDGWKINGCPTNSAAVSADGDHLAAAWFTAGGGNRRVQLAFSQNGGRSFGQPIVLDNDRPIGRASVALLSDGSAVAVWIGLDRDSRAQLKARRVWSEGRMGPPTVLSTAGSRYGFPVAAPAPGGVAVVWTDGSKGIRVSLLQPANPVH